MSSGPSISVVVAAYNAEAYVAETITAILGQTRAPDEVIVVDDGSSDGTPAELARFGSAIRTVRQANSSAAGAYNRAFAEARGDYVARCDADDVWLPTKLERQAAAIAAHPEIDLAVGAAWIFGREDRLFAPHPGDGVLEPRAFAHAMYDWNLVCSSTAVLRRELIERLGPLVPGLACEDYDYWLRALRAGATVYHDPEVLVRYRQHGANVTNNLVRMYEHTHRTHLEHAALVDDRGLVRRVLARDQATIGRMLVDDRPRDARKAFGRSLRFRPTPGAAAWMGVLSLPGRWRPALIDASTTLKRTVAPAR